MSVHEEGRGDAVRYQLPPGAMQMLERADNLELLAIERVEDWPGDGPMWFDELDANTLVSVRLLRDFDRHAVVAALYRGIRDGRGVGLCFHPHHALRATRGDETLSVVVCLNCMQARVGEGQPFVAIDPAAVGAVWTPIIESRSDLRFDPGRGPFGRWIQQNKTLGGDVVEGPARASEPRRVERK